MGANAGTLTSGRPVDVHFARDPFVLPRLLQRVIYPHERSAPSIDPVESRPDVLIVDDDPATCSALAERLAADGVSSTSVHDGVAAIQRAITLRPQLIVLDLGLPELSGDQVFERLQADHRTRYTPVVFPSGTTRCATSSPAGTIT